MSLDFEKLPRFKDQGFRIVSLVCEWAFAYQVEPAAIERQIPIAHAWCNSNPKRAPKRDAVRFLNNWMRIAKGLGTLVTQEPDRRYKESATQEDMTIKEMIEIRQKNMQATTESRQHPLNRG